MKILIDNGHGRNTSGKRSPDGMFREYAYARLIADRIVRQLRKEGIDAELLVPEQEDISLKERCSRANAICIEEGSSQKVLLISIHCNAAGSGMQWMNARGWSAHVSCNASHRSKQLAIALINAAEDEGLKVRRNSPNRPYWTQDLAICRDTHCAAVLTENLFQDNKQDVEILFSEEGKQKITRLHINAIKNFIKKEETK